MESAFDSFNTSISSLFESIIEFIQLKVKGILQLLLNARHKAWRLFAVALNADVMFTSLGYFPHYLF